MSPSLSTKLIRVSEPFPHVLHLELNRKPVNAFNAELRREFLQTFETILSSSADVRAVVISSALPKIFTAGIDLTDIPLPNPSSGDPSRTGIQTRELVKHLQHCVGAPLRMPFPVIAAIHGPVMGLGVDLLSSCDIRYAATDATFCIKEVDVGLAADLGTLALFPKITSNDSLVRELAYTARPFSSSEAEKLGFVSKLVPGSRNEVVSAALDLARVISEKSPIAVYGSKALIRHSRDHSIGENLDYTALWNAMMLQTPDLKEATKSAKKNQSPQFNPLKPKL